jgi:hypothetical protein
MDTDSGQQGRDPVQGSDLEYDLAHETKRPRGAAPAQDNQTEDPVQVATETPDYDGDYGYDLAHDVPGR